MSKELFKKTERILYNYSMLKAEINNLGLEIEELENEYEGIGAISYEERSGNTNKISDSVANEIIFREKEIYRLNKMKRSKEILLSMEYFVAQLRIVSSVKKFLSSNNSTLYGSLHPQNSHLEPMMSPKIAPLIPIHTPPLSLLLLYHTHNYLSSINFIVC